MRPICRRQFVATLAAAVPVLASARPLLAESRDTRALDFVHTHTGEKLSVEYALGDRYLPDALDTVNHFLRDFRTGDVHVIDRGLLDLLHNLARLTETRQTVPGHLRLSLAQHQRHAPPRQRRRGRPQPSHAGPGDRHPSRRCPARQAPRRRPRDRPRRRRLLPRLGFRARRYGPRRVRAAGKKARGRRQTADGRRRLLPSSFCLQGARAPVVSLPSCP